VPWAVSVKNGEVVAVVPEHYVADFFAKTDPLTCARAYK
jgi:hypothetical protein